MVSDLKKMMKSCRESWRRDSKVASQAVILMFIPIILGLGFNTRAAWEKKDWRGKPNLEEYEGEGEDEAGKPPPPSPPLLHPLILEAVQLRPWQEHQQQGQAGEKRQICIDAKQGQITRIQTSLWEVTGISGDS